MANNGAADWGQSALPSFDGQFDALSLTPRIVAEWAHTCDDQCARPIGDNRPYRSQGALSLTPRNGTECGHVCGEQWRGRLGTIGPTVRTVWGVIPNAPQWDRMGTCM